MSLPSMAGPTSFRSALAAGLAPALWLFVLMLCPYIKATDHGQTKTHARFDGRGFLSKSLSRRDKPPRRRLLRRLASATLVQGLESWPGTLPAPAMSVKPTFFDRGLTVDAGSAIHNLSVSGFHVTY